jgi:ribosomal subunit interface protein
MRLELTGRHTDISPALRRLVDVRIAKLERILNNGAVSAQVVLTRERFRHRTEITLHTRGERFLHGVGKAPSWEVSVGEAADKIAQQAQKLKGKWQERKRRGRPVPDAIVEAPAERLAAQKVAPAATVRARMPPILRTSRQTVKPMSVVNAAREVIASEEGVVVFRDPQTVAISVLYRRANGELVLIETET